MLWHMKSWKKTHKSRVGYFSKIPEKLSSALTVQSALKQRK